MSASLDWSQVRIEFKDERDALQATLSATRLHSLATIQELRDALRALTDWGREHTSPCDPNSPHALLIAACAVLDKLDSPAHAGSWATCTLCNERVRELEQDSQCVFCIGSGERKGEPCKHCGGTGEIDGLTTSDAQGVAMAEHMRAQS